MLAALGTKPASEPGRLHCRLHGRGAGIVSRSPDRQIRVFLDTAAIVDAGLPGQRGNADFFVAPTMGRLTIFKRA